MSIPTSNLSNHFRLLFFFDARSCRVVVFFVHFVVGPYYPPFHTHLEIPLYTLTK